MIHMYMYVYTQLSNKGFEIFMAIVTQQVEVEVVSWTYKNTKKKILNRSTALHWYGFWVNWASWKGRMKPPRKMCKKQKNVSYKKKTVPETIFEKKSCGFLRKKY